ncbi:calcium-binding protein, partial [Leisingera sp. McT4-56]|uniref:calcium-binding protein n=1 Tax=Leisingera sp. McT4-56 TaxID=2881255 RepID=UPI001CF8D1FF
SRLVVGFNGFTITFQGSFNYNSSNEVTAGSTISAFTMRYDGTTVLSVTGLDLTYEDLATQDLETLLQQQLAGNDTYTSAWNGGEYIETYGGDDTIQSGTGDDTINGGSGHDTFVIDADKEIGGYGFHPTYGVYVFSSMGEVEDYLLNVEVIENGSVTREIQEGSDSADTIISRTTGDVNSKGMIHGRGGNDTITGGASFDFIMGGYGDDSVFGGKAYDLILGGYGNDHLFGEGGGDIIHGDYGNDRVFGNAGRDSLYGGLGDDSLFGGNGNDSLLGDGTIQGGGSSVTYGHDRLAGGAGNDTLQGGSGNDTLLGGDDQDKLKGDSGDDLLDGGRGGDRLFGGAGRDNMKGGAGHDRMSGGGGNDTMSGGTGDDTLMGGNGRDVLLGHKGDDLLAGGAHADIFVFHQGHGNDTITDFTAGEDHIRIGRGADDLGGLQFQAQGDDVLVSFADVTILVQDITVAQLQDAENFLF